jgi:hypothetical protein
MEVVGFLAAFAASLVIGELIAFVAERLERR